MTKIIDSVNWRKGFSLKHTIITTLINAHLTKEFHNKINQGCHTPRKFGKLGIIVSSGKVRK